jgi:hypothetical protein
VNGIAVRMEIVISLFGRIGKKIYLKPDKPEPKKLVSRNDATTQRL